MKIICISDTHTEHDDINLENADILVCSGDSTHSYLVNNRNTEEQVFHFIDWLSIQNIKYKVYIAGNNDGMYTENNVEKVKKYALSKGVFYLSDSSVIIDGYKVYGSSWNLAYSINRGFGVDTEIELEDKFALIEDDTNILLTHTPPYEILDKNAKGVHCGSLYLSLRIQKLKNLKCSIFGHIHEANGIEKQNGVIYVNAAYSKKNPYSIIEIE
jgi:Icc-related predicted phosphoesterase